MEKIEPCTCYFVDDKAGRLGIDVRLPGVQEKDVTLEMKKDNFCVRALKGEDLEYSGCFVLPQEIESDKRVARFEDGLLRIIAPKVRGWVDRIIYRPLA
jgi:HSP20 family molecular chaperone IbpA